MLIKQENNINENVTVFKTPLFLVSIASILSIGLFPHFR